MISSVAEFESQGENDLFRLVHLMFTCDLSLSSKLSFKAAVSICCFIRVCKWTLLTMFMLAGWEVASKVEKIRFH